MYISSLFISILLPIQIKAVNPDQVMINSNWVVCATIDAAIVSGLPSFRKKTLMNTFNEEFLLKSDGKSDKQITKRRQYIQNLLNSSVT